MTEKNDLIFKVDSSDCIIYDPKKQTNRIEFPKNTSLETIIDFLNDCNFECAGELEEKWKDFMPNKKKVDGV